MKDKTIGFLGLGTMGFPMCYNLAKAGYHMCLPAFRKEEDCLTGFSDRTPDKSAKLAAYNEMIQAGAVAAATQKELARVSDVILISMPNSKFVESLMFGEDGIIENIKSGSIVIDLTSADPISTQKLSRLLAEKGVEMLDAPVSGGVAGSVNHTLSIMVGGRKEVFDTCLPILHTIGSPEKLQYIGPSGAGHTLKVANNFLSACCTAATTEALMVCAKAGIDPQVAAQVIGSSGGRSDASMNKYPNYVFPGNPFRFTMNLMTKDIGLFTAAAKEFKVPSFLSSLTLQLWDVPVAKGKGEDDCMELVKLYEDWCGVELFGIGKKD